MVNYEIKEFQMRALEVLRVIDKVCKEHGLRYYLADGTLLGAVRHKGFIPWDDDADITMPRPDLDIFIANAKDWLPAPYELNSFEVNGKSTTVFPKVMDSSTTLIERMWFNQLGGVYVDIFPLEGHSNSKLVRQLHVWAYYFMKDFIRNKNRDPYKRGKGASSWWPKIVQKVFTNEGLQRFIQRIQKYHDYDSATLVGEFEDKTFGVMTKDVFGEPTPIMFEGYELMGPAKPHEYLTKIFGDYMTLPPENKRRIHGFDYVDLNTPYREYNDTREFRKKMMNEK